jgi:hypothetical protein
MQVAVRVKRSGVGVRIQGSDTCSIAVRRGIFTCVHGISCSGHEMHDFCRKTTRML